jgi:manganese transport protein
MSLALPAGAVRSRTAWLRLAGPAFAVSIGYIDPGNWAADLAAGVYHFSLLWVVLAANAIALVVQLAVIRVTVATGRDLASLIGERWGRYRVPLWLAFEGAVIATDVAEFTGITLGAQLLFHLTTALSAGIGVAVVFALLCAGRGKLRLFDVAMIGVLGLVAIAYVALLHAVNPDLAAVGRGALVPAIPDRGAVLVIVAIIGATVMPHNLFLHSALVRGRLDATPPHERPGIGRFFSRETWVALNIAALINGAILIVGASVHGSDATIAGAFAHLQPLGGLDTSAIFGAALLLSGIAASTTATLTGDVIFGTFAPVRVPLAVRRAVTVLPAAGLLLVGTDGTAMLLWSQMALCLVLPVALAPLLVLLRESERDAGGRRRHGFFALCTATCAVCGVLDIALLWQSLSPS